MTAKHGLDYRTRLPEGPGWRCLLPLRFDPKISEWVGQPQRVFKPRGLAIWGAPPRAELRHVLIGVDLQVVCDCAPVPARFFAFGDSYEQIAKKIDEGLEPPAWCDWKPIYPGQLLRLALTCDGEPIGAAGCEQLAMWGVAVDGP